MKLYYVQRTRSVRAAWMLEEVGVAYERIKLDPATGDTRTPEYLNIHPMGKVPALVDGDLTLFESGAIALYLADKFPDKLLGAPLGSHDRALIYQWCFFAASTIEEPIVQVLRLSKRGEAMTPDVQEVLDRAWTALETTLAGKQFLVGERFTAADLLVAASVGWAMRMKVFSDRPVLAAYVQRCTSRPAFAAALAATG